MSTDRQIFKKHSWICLKAYRFFLLGEDEALGGLDIPESELEKMKKFHEKLESGHMPYTVGKGFRFPEFVSRGMGLMYRDWANDKPIRDLYPSSESRPRICRVYNYILDGMSENEIRLIGFTDSEIEFTFAFQKYETADMLPVTISQRTNIKVSTVEKLQKTYRERIQQAGTVTRIEMREGMNA